MPRIKASHDVNLPSSVPFSVQAAVQGGPDIVVAPPEAMLKSVIEDEKFMNEPMEIRCLETSDPNAPKAVEIAVQTGGITGPMTKDAHGNLIPGVPSRGGKLMQFVFERGKKYTVPRFVYEALAHSKVTTLKQSPHPHNPMEILQTQHHTFFYQFECLRDSNTSAKATAWREKVLADPA
mgnify:CR=1 FL=1